MPKSGFSYTRLMPIDNSSVLQQERQRVELTLQFNVAERLLLAAMYRKRQVNPLDYIYRYNR